MENETQEEVKIEQKSSLRQVTPLSKYLAMGLFIILPFLGGYAGYSFAPDKVVEIEKIVEIENSEERESDTETVLQKGSFATNTIDQGEYTVELTPTQIIVKDNVTRQNVQTIEWNAYGFWDYSRDSNTYVVTGRDINYDHYLDLGVLQTIGQGSDLFYGFYTFDPEQRLLIRDNTLGDGFETEGKTIVNPSFDIENKTVTTCVMGPVALKEYRCSEFVFDGKGYEKGDDWIESWE